MIVVQSTSKSQAWSLNLRNRVGDTVTHAGKTWVNKTGKNSEPGVGNDWETANSDGGGGLVEPITVTRAEILVLVGSAALSVGAQYKITDADINLYGGTEITLTAITENQLSLQGSGKFFTPKYDLTEEGNGYGIWTKFMSGAFYNISGAFEYGELVVAQNGAQAYYLVEGLLDFIDGDWSLATSIVGSSTSSTADVGSFTSPSYLIGQIVHWGGKSWENVGGTVGVSVNKYELDTSHWQELPFNEDNYDIHIDEIHYDFLNDMIIHRKDKYNNIVSGSHQVFTEFAALDGWNFGNPIKDFQWGCGQNNFNTDDYFTNGIQGNKVIDSYFETLNCYARQIWNNEVTKGSYIYSNIFSKETTIYLNVFQQSAMSDNILSGSSNISNNFMNFQNAQFQGNSFYQVNFNLNTLVGYFGNNKGRELNVNANHFGILTQVHSNLFISSQFYSNRIDNGGSVANNDINASSISYVLVDFSSQIYQNSLAENSSINFSNLANGSSISYNILTNNCQITNNELNIGQINNNEMFDTCYISNNQLLSNSQINQNVISQSSFINNNTLKASFVNQVDIGTSSAIQNNQFFGCQMNLGTTGALFSKSIQNTTFQGGALADDISTAVYIFQPQSKTVFTKPNGLFAVSFIDNMNTLHIVNIED